MAKVTGSYASVVRGVSQQVPQDRRPGQHFEQVNMISDPVRGLARRHGSLMQDEVITAPFSQATWDAMVADTARHKEFTFFVGGVEYSLIYRTTASPNAALRQPGFAWCFNKDERKFIPIVYSTGDPVMTELQNGGVSAAVNVGKYLYLGGNTITPTWTPTSHFDNAPNKRKLAIWVRGGAYATEFVASLIKADGSKLLVDYKTKTSSYPGLLDTSDLSATDPDYQKKVLDRTNAYNSAVTKWIGEAAEDATPENIANKLAASFTAAGVTGLTVQGSTVLIDDPQFVEASADDGGDGTLIRAVGNEVTAADLVSNIHFAGKVVKVRPKKHSQEDAFYLEAIPKEGSTTIGEVSWRETSGYQMQPQNVLVQATVVGGTLYMAGSAAKLQALTGVPHPQYKANMVGDDLSCPLPYFFGKRIDYLGMFQDRLVIGSGATLFFSRPGDYFNWFRTSVLTVDDRDPIEMYALGSEDDTIKTSTTYDRNILLFGKRMQYTVNGRQPLTPKSASIVILSAHEDAVDAEPQNSGNFVFYAKWRNGAASLHQIQMGVLADTPESFNVSQQLDSYLQGKPVQIVAVTSPNTVLLRTDASRTGFFVYTYLDTPAGSERLFDAWSRWEWNETVGQSVAIGRHDGDILSFTLRRGKDRTGAEKIWIACDRFVLDTQLSDYPYADTLRPAAKALTPGSNDFINTASDQFEHIGVVAFNRSSEYQFVGTYLERLEEFVDDYGMGRIGELSIGVDFPATFTPTNPYVMDRHEKAIVNGRLTIANVRVSVTESGGMAVDVDSSAGLKRTLDFNGRLAGRASNLVGRQPIITTSVQATIGKEVRECQWTVSARNWLPLTVTAIEWTGQFFNNARRV